MAGQQKHSWGDRLRKVLAELEQLLLGPQPKPAPVPVPVRVPRDSRHHR
jgi:hypothetical protein